ncbi:hypothetical protein GCM10010385_47760 [Streptomyces geysiriensis]|nr:hypothetical protein GCM10010385_47760 [Streptomyces geysiriensis]GHC30098.1 hypothetical protein GCM10010308_54610 [Streptomyces vinaceusdrappus]
MTDMVRSGRASTVTYDQCRPGTATPPGARRPRVPARRRHARAGTPVNAVTTGSSAWCISSPIDRKKVSGAP